MSTQAREPSLHVQALKVLVEIANKRLAKMTAERDQLRSVLDKVRAHSRPVRYVVEAAEAAVRGESA